MWVVEAIGKRMEGALENVTPPPLYHHHPLRPAWGRQDPRSLELQTPTATGNGKRNLSSSFMGIFTCL